MVKRTYKLLLETYGYQDWWPVHEGSDKFLEISIGAILTQNTNWRNVEKAIKNLLKENLLDWETLSQIEEEKLKECIKPAGFYNQKAKTIKEFVRTIKDINRDRITRELLLSIKGIGNETADSILLYGPEKPFFVIDSYTKRLFYRLGIINKKNIKYEELQSFIIERIERDIEVYKQYHALIVEHSKIHCRKKPNCINCPLEKYCTKML